MTLADYTRALLRHWVLIVVMAALGAALGLVMAERSTPVYRSTSSVLLTAEARGSSSDLVQGSAYVSNLVDSYVRVATSELVLGPVVEDLGLDRSPRNLANSITAEAQLNTFVIDISVVDSDAVEAQRITQAVAGELDRAAEVISPSSEGGRAVRLTTITQATLPVAPIAPDRRLYLAVGFLLGAGAAVAFALGRRAFGTNIADSGDVRTVTDQPVLGEIVEAKASLTLPQAVLSDQLGREAESLRALAANLRFMAVGRPVQSVVVTSGHPKEAKSSVSVGAALVLAEAAERVLLVDADLRAPSIAHLTGLSNAVGLSDVLVGGVGLRDAVHGWGVEGLDVLTSGTPPPNPAQLLGSDSMRSLLAEAAQRYDHIIIDSPPVLLVTDPLWLAHKVDGILVVARRGRTTTRDLARALRALEGTPVLGVVLSRVSRTGKAEYGRRPGRSTGRRPGRRRASVSADG